MSQIRSSTNASVNAAADCDKSITVKSNGDTKISCKTVKGSVTFDSDDISGAIDLSGIEEIEGDLVIKENKNIQSLSSSSLAKIGGKFQLDQLEALTAINFNSLEEVKEIEWISLTALETVQFGTEGVTRINKVRISDSSLSSLDGLSMESVGTFKIDNNKQLLKWKTLLTEIKDELIVADNSEDLEVSFPELTSAGDIDVRGVKGLDMPLLEKISGSFLLTDNNVMEAFIAPNLTQTGESVSLRNNGGLSNVSFPLLTRTGGGLTVHNNQNLLEIDGFPKLEKVAGSVTMRGNFTE
ncbi:hypothetical protein IMZ48_14025 [Candidatus Bathyarchaeota archaeon]|nr:hypothetical protein [Candidatus Bathyarchaeota archaeon]